MTLPEETTEIGIFIVGQTIYPDGSVKVLDMINLVFAVPVERSLFQAFIKEVKALKLASGWSGVLDQSSGNPQRVTFRFSNTSRPSYQQACNELHKFGRTYSERFNARRQAVARAVSTV